MRISELRMLAGGRCCGAVPELVLLWDPTSCEAMCLRKGPLKLQMV